MISEIDLPTEASVLGEKEIASEPEKPESFVELFEKYDALFINNSTVVEERIDDGGMPLQKRSSLDDDNSSDSDIDGKSLIEKIQTIDDPEVRKEFEFEIDNKGQGLDKEEAKASEEGIKEYEPDYTNKLVADKKSEAEIQLRSDSENSIQDFNTDEASKKLTLHEKEVLQGHLVEQLVHSNDTGVEFTTIIPEDFLIHHENIHNPEIVDVLEHIVYQSGIVETTKHTTDDPLNVQVDFDPIEIIPKDRHRFRNVDGDETETNDKFVGFKPTEDLVEPGQETTEPDQFFKKVDEDEDSADAIVETLELVGIYGKSLKVQNESQGNEIEVRTEKTLEATTVVQQFESVTEIVEVRTEFSVNIHVGEAEKKPNDSEDSHKHSSSSSSSSNKSSEESNSSKSNESKEKVAKDSSESSEENTAREIFDTDEFRILDLQIRENQKLLMSELYKDTMKHGITKKDHPDELTLSLPHEVAERKFNVEDEIAQHLEDKIKPQDETLETTTVGIYETMEDIVTTMSDGIKLSGDLRASVHSFLGSAEENKTVLDTNSEIISSKNIKNSLVNISEEMTLENHVERSEISYGVLVSLIAFVSATTLLIFFTVLKKRSIRLIPF